MTIISLFDLTGNWSKPWKNAKYNIRQIDIQLGEDILEWDYKKEKFDSVYGILAAIPCTDYALSGAKYFYKKDHNGQTEKSNLLVKKTLEIIKYFNPVFWVVENPMSRIHKLNPELGKIKYKFNPCDFAGYTNNEEDRYNKQTWLWGRFNIPKVKYLPPLMTGLEWKDREKIGKGIERQNARSITPMGFSIAFYEANKPESIQKDTLQF